MAIKQSRKPGAKAKKSSAAKPAAKAARATAKRRTKPKPPPPATTIGDNPLDTPATPAAVIAAIFGPEAGRKAEGKRSRRR
jgi:hypothetical protein